MKRPVNEAMKAYISDNNLLQKDISAYMHISESRLSYMLNGGRRITVDDFFDFCRAVSADPQQLYNTEVS